MDRYRMAQEHGTSSSRESARGTNDSQKTSHIFFESLHGQDLSLSANVFKMPHLWVRHSFWCRIWWYGFSNFGSGSSLSGSPNQTQRRPHGLILVLVAGDDADTDAAADVSDNKKLYT